MRIVCVFRWKQPWTDTTLRLHASPQVYLTGSNNLEKLIYDCLWFSYNMHFQYFTLSQLREGSYHGLVIMFINSRIKCVYVPVFWPMQKMLWCGCYCVLVFDIVSIWWMLTLAVFSLLWWSCRTFRAAWRFACGSHNSIFMGPRKCTSGGDRYMRSRDRYTYRQERPSTSGNIRQGASSQDSFSSWTHSQCLGLTVVFTNPQTSGLTKY